MDEKKPGKEIVEQGPATYLMLDEISVTLSEILKELRGECPQPNAKFDVESEKKEGVKEGVDKGIVYKDVVKKEENRGVVPETLKQLKDISQKLDKSNESLQNLYQSTDVIRKNFAADKGFDPNVQYFNQDLTAITVDTPNKPKNPNIIADPTTVPPTPGYDRITVYEDFERLASTLTVSNDGTAILYVTASNDGETWSEETQILKGEFKRFFNVYELRIRSPFAGTINSPVIVAGNTVTTFNQGGIYRATEHKIESALVNINRTAIFISTFPNVPVVGAGFTTFTITGPLVNTTSAFRASVKNTNVVYVTYKGGSLTIASQRLTLNPGDAMKANLTNGGQVFFAGAVAGQTVELLTESDVA